MNFYVYCLDRAIFSVNLEYQNIYASYEIDYSKDEDPWAVSYDESKIFKSFVDEIVLTQEDKPAAKVKKGQGLLWFVDETGRTWTAK